MYKRSSEAVRHQLRITLISLNIERINKAATATIQEGKLRLAMVKFEKILDMIGSNLGVMEKTEEEELKRQTGRAELPSRSSQQHAQAMTQMRQSPSGKGGKREGS